MGHYGDLYDAERELQANAKKAERELQANAKKLRIKNITTNLNQVLLDLCHDRDEEMVIARQCIQTAVLWLNKSS